MATYNDDGTHTDEPGESNDRAVPPPDGDPAAPDVPPVEGDAGSTRRGITHPSHPIATPGPDRPGHPIAPTPGPKHRG